MLSLTAKTMFLSMLMAWILLFLCACGVRCRALRGSLLLRPLCSVLMQSAWPYISASGKALCASYPVLCLAALSGVLFDVGLLDVAVITLAAAFITQLWRFEFPTLPALVVVLGWDPATIFCNQELVLSGMHRALIIVAFWGIVSGGILALFGSLTHGILLVISGSLLATLRLRSILRLALALERG